MSRRHTCRRTPCTILVVTTCLLVIGPLLLAQAPASRPEEIEWTWEVRPPHADPHLPNVLLLGDSISRSYFPQVTQDLSGVANVYLMASSTSVGDPRLPQQIAEFGTLQKVPFSVIHFNNGMHGWQYTEAEYRAAFPAFLAAVRALPGHARLIWATTTPVKIDTPDAATAARINARNAIAQSFVRPAALTNDDLYTLMTSHRDLYQDNVHFTPAGATLMGDQAAASIRQALSAPAHKDGSPHARPPARELPRVFR